MENKVDIFKNWKIWIILIFVILIIIFIINYNNLSKYETVEKFIDLISQSEYKEAKKYITKNFDWDLSVVKKKELKKAKSFINSYKNYKLDDEYDIAYIESEGFSIMFLYKFKLKKTIFGYKIDDCQYEAVKY